MSYALTDDEPHEATPVKGSLIREVDGKPGSLLNRDDYPLIGSCQECEGQIYVEWFRVDFVHVDQPKTPLLSPEVR